jgi:hypothetical protein
MKSYEPGSSVSIVSGYGLDDRAIGVRYPAEAENFSSSVCVQTGSGTHPASCPLTPSSAEVVNEQELHFLSPQAPPGRVVGLLYFF